MRAPVAPSLERVARRIGRPGGVERGVEAQQNAFRLRDHCARQRHRRPRVAHAAQPGDRVDHVAPARHLKPREVELPVGRAHRAVQRREIKRPRDAHDRGLVTRSAPMRQHAENFRLVKADMNKAVVERAHLRVKEPDLGNRRGVHRVRQPHERIGDGRGVDFFRQEIREESVELAVAHDVQRRRRDVVSLLIARGDKSRADIHPDVGLAKSVAEPRGATPVGRNTQDRAIVFTERVRLLVALRDHKLSGWRKPKGGGKFPRVGRLREGVGKQFVHVGLAIAIGVPEPPDTVAIENVNLAVADRGRHRLVQTRGEPPPTHHALGGLKASRQPHVAVDGHEHARAVGQKLDIRRPHFSPPGIILRQLHRIDHVGLRRDRALDGRHRLLRPTRPSPRHPRTRRDHRTARSGVFDGKLDCLRSGRDVHDRDSGHLHERHRRRRFRCDPQREARLGTFPAHDKSQGRRRRAHGEISRDHRAVFLNRAGGCAPTFTHADAVYRVV